VQAEDRLLQIARAVGEDPGAPRGRRGFYVELVRGWAVRTGGVDGRGCLDGGPMVSRFGGRGVRRDRASASPRRPAKSPLRSSMRDENGDMFVDSDRLVIREVTA
jgi:hypothetical protein